MNNKDINDLVDSFKLDKINNLKKEKTKNKITALIIILVLIIILLLPLIIYYYKNNK
jgi:predicted nucleic acid-binding Zn ribbon protein